MSVSPADLLGPYVTVFDVGAFRGDFARACLDEWPECAVHSFEPLEPSPNDQCRFNMSPNGDVTRWHWHPCALGNQCDVVDINRNVFVPSSSMLPMARLHESAFPYTKGSEVVRVGMATLDEFFDVLGDAPRLLKIDVQGYELEVLKGGRETIDMFAAIVLEVSHEPLYDGAPTADELAEYLLAAGFLHHSRADALYHPKIPKLLLQSDELWVRA